MANKRVRTNVYGSRSPTWGNPVVSGPIIGPATRRASEREGRFHGKTQALCRVALLHRQLPYGRLGPERSRADAEQALQFAVVGHQIDIQPVQRAAQPWQRVTAESQ
jgi:hypothetical protein